MLTLAALSPAGSVYVTGAAILRFVGTGAVAAVVAGGAVSRRVVNVASVSATRGAIGQMAYSSAKSGLFGLTRSLAKEWGPMNVTANCVSFGLVETRLTAVTEGEATITIGDRQHRVGFNAQALEGLVKNIPLGRKAPPEEAAAGLLLFCLPGSSYITGQCVEVAGGIIY